MVAGWNAKVAGPAAAEDGRPPADAGGYELLSSAAIEISGAGVARPLSRIARHLLSAGDFFGIEAGRLVAAMAADRDRLNEALDAASRGAASGQAQSVASISPNGRLRLLLTPVGDDGHSRRLLVPASSLDAAVPLREQHVPA